MGVMRTGAVTSSSSPIKEVPVSAGGDVFNTAVADQSEVQAPKTLTSRLTCSRLCSTKWDVTGEM